MPTFDKTQLDSLVSALEQGNSDLATATDANTKAQTVAATAAADLSAKQAANKANVAALKNYVAGLDDAGNTADAAPQATPPTDTAPVDTTPADTTTPDTTPVTAGPDAATDANGPTLATA